MPRFMQGIHVFSFASEGKTNVDDPVDLPVKPGEGHDGKNWEGPGGIP